MTKEEHSSPLKALESVQRAAAEGNPLGGFHGFQTKRRHRGSHLTATRRGAFLGSLPLVTFASRGTHVIGGKVYKTRKK